MTSRAVEPTTPDWTDAVCRETDPEMFFPSSRESFQAWTVRSEHAKALCRTCPLMVDCFEYAYEAGEEWGVWGGHRADEIRVMRRRHQRAERRTS